MLSKSKLKRARQIMPAFIRAALAHKALLTAYKQRPPYQRNDYLGWINRAKREETKQKRLNQMLQELANGELYMNMRWSQNSLRARENR